MELFHHNPPGHFPEPDVSEMKVLLCSWASPVHFSGVGDYLANGGLKEGV